METCGICIYCVPNPIFPIVRIGKRIRKISTQTQESFGDLSSKLSQLFMGIKTVKSFNMENYEKNIGNTIEGIFSLHTKLTKLVQLLGHSWKHLAVLQLQVLYGLEVVKLLPEKQHQVLFFSFITALIMAYQPVKSLAGLNATLQNAMAAAQRVFFIIDNKTNILDKGDKDIGILDSQKIKTIYLKDINFRYTSSKRLILKNISIMFEHAKKTAIVGPSGAGKTSLLNLLPRFYDLQKGEDFN